MPTPPPTPTAAPRDLKRKFEAIKDEPTSPADIIDFMISSDESDGDADAMDIDQDLSDYNQSSEAFPRHPAYVDEHGESENGNEPHVETLAKNLTIPPTDILNVFRKHKFKSDGAQKLSKMASKLNTVPETKGPKVAFMGATGAGKSHLINSVTDIHGSAKSMSSGESVTTAVTVFRRKFKNQKLKFAVNIEYLDSAAIKDLLQELIKDYSDFAFRSEELEKEWTEGEEFILRKQRHQSAFKTLQLLFRDQKQFATPSAASDSLKAGQEDGCKALLDFLACVCDGILSSSSRKKNRTGTYQYFEAGSPKGLKDTMKPILEGTITKKQPALWPLVKRVMY